MMRIFGRLVLPVGCLAFSGCALEFNECGVGGVGCSGPESICICTSGRCAEEDEDCASGLHYVGGRCVGVDEAPSAIPSTPDRPGNCTSRDGGGDISDASDGHG